MPFIPRTAQDIAQRIGARVIARSRLSDLSEGSVVLSIVVSVAEALASVEQRLRGIRDSFFFEGVSGGDLDDRCRELPNGGVLRQSPVSATGSVLSITRGDTSTSFVLRQGATFRQTPNPRQLYRTVSDVVFGIGVATVNNVSIVAVTPGEEGNTPSGTIRILEDVPSEIIAANNTLPLRNGQNEESDGRLRARALSYLSSLSRAQPAAILYRALSFVDSNQVRARFANLFEDPNRPGYSELVIDDGSGGAGGTRLGNTSSGTVPAAGALLLWHESPATRPIEKITVDRGGNVFDLRAIDGDFTSVPERGIVYPTAGILQAGDMW